MVSRFGSNVADCYLHHSHFVTFSRIQSAVSNHNIALGMAMLLIVTRYTSDLDLEYEVSNEKILHLKKANANHNGVMHHNYI